MKADVITSHAELLDRIRVAYDDYSNLIGTFSESALTKEATVGTWSVRDVIVHIGGDERWMAGQLEALRSENSPLRSPATASTCRHRQTWTGARTDGTPGSASGSPGSRSMTSGRWRAKRTRDCWL